MRGFRLLPPDGSRDQAIDDPTNVWIIHPAGRLLLPLALRLGVPANAVSIAGFVFGTAAAAAFLRWPSAAMATTGFALAVGWLIADGLDGMIARATGTSSVLGRLLDGVCDHAVFVLLYVGLAWTIGGFAWTLASVAGAFHALQATLFEGERARFHRRIRGEALPPASSHGNPVVRGYDALAGSLDRLAAPFDEHLAAAADPHALAGAYRAEATPPLRLLALLSNNMRVIVIYAACLAGDPAWFWWLEIGPLTLVAIAGIAWHRRVERRMLVAAA